MLTAAVLMAMAVGAGVLVLMRRMRALGLWWASWSGTSTESELATLFIFVPASRLLAMTVGLTAACITLCIVARLPLPLVFVIGVASLAAPRLIMLSLRARWRRQLVQQLPDAMGLWAGLLRAGQSSQQALGQVAQRQRGALGAELRFVQGQLRMGVSLERAFSALCARADVGDLRLLATLLATQRELGGNLAESLQRLADLLRGRLLMEARIGSLTAQGRLQGLVVGVLPLLVMAALYWMEPDAMRVLHTTWQGWVALLVIGVLEVVGFVLIRRIVRIEV